jgi:preprotein translocase subunit SecE
MLRHVGVCSSAGRAAISKVVGRGFESLRTRYKKESIIMTQDFKVSTFPVREKRLNFFRQLQQELYKVNWTTKEELILYTKIVLGATFVFAIGIYVAEIVLQLILNMFSFITKFIGG